MTTYIYIYIYIYTYPYRTIRATRLAAAELGVAGERHVEAHGPVPLLPPAIYMYNVYTYIYIYIYTGVYIYIYICIRI